MATATGFSRITSLIRRPPAQLAAPTIVNLAPRGRGRLRRAGAGTLGVLKPMAGGGAAAGAYALLEKVSDDPLNRALMLGGTALLVPAIPGLRQLAPGYAGGAGFAIVQAARAKLSK